jgi:ATP-dependent helicase/nuclease subunit A
VLLGGPSDQALSKVRQDEAADIADTIERAVDREGWMVGDRTHPDGVRPAQRRDVAILLPTRTSLPQLEGALEERGVPYRVESASLVWDTQAVRDLLAVLNAIDDPTDEVALVAALRAPVLACSDADLFEFRQAGGTWNLRTPCPEALEGHPVCRAIDTLRALHERRWWEGVAALVERAVRELRFHHLALAHGRARDQWRRLRFVVDQARAFEEAGGRTLRAFTAWAELQAADDARVREPSLPEDDDDAVRILTVHGAKGLEFPIVFLSGLNRAAGGGGGPSLLWNGDTPEARAGRFVTPGFAALNEVERQLEALEQTRLLYVAATRARDHLVVSVHHKARVTRCQAAFVLEACEAFPDLWRRLGEPPFRLEQVDATVAPIADPDAAAERQRWAAARDARIDMQRRVAVRAATAIAERGTDAKDEPDVAAPPWRRGRAGTAIGRAVHAVLQSVDLATGEGCGALAVAQSAAEGIDESSGDVDRLARAAIDSDVVRQAVASPRLYRELYVAAPIGDTLIEGFVDLAFDLGDDRGLVLVDYKTDAVRPDQTDAAVRRYRLQLAAYAMVLEALGQPVSRAVLLFVGGGVARQRDITDLPAAVREVRQLVAEVGGG